MAQSYSEINDWNNSENYLNKSFLKNNKDLHTFYLVKIYLSTGRWENALELFSQLENSPVKNYFRNKLRLWIENNFNGIAKTRKILPFLQAIYNSSPEFFESYKISNIYKEGLEFNGRPVPDDIMKNLWLFPTDLNVAQESGKLLLPAALTPDDYLKKVNHLKSLQKKEPWNHEKVQTYIFEFIESLGQCDDDDKCELIGHEYLQTLFNVGNEAFRKIIDSAKSNVFMHRYSVSEEYELFYRIRSHQRLSVKLFDNYGELSNEIRQEASQAEDALQILIENHPKFKWLANTVRKMGETYNLIGLDDKADYWWNQTTKLFFNSNKYLERKEVDEAYWRRVWVLI